MERTANCLAKLERMNKTLHHEEPDRVPISDFFWGGFLSRWRIELGLAADTDIYRYYDLDWRVVAPNMDPHIRQFEILRDDATEVTVHTGFGATIRKKFDLPMPAFVGFDTDSVEKMEAFQFDDPFDERRYFRAGDDQINGVGDGFESEYGAVSSIAWPPSTRISPSTAAFAKRHEMIWRIVGTENVMLWMGEFPDAIARFVARLHEFNLGVLRAQIQAARGPSGRHHHLGRRGLQERHAFLARQEFRSILNPQNNYGRCCWQPCGICRSRILASGDRDGGMRT